MSKKQKRRESRRNKPEVLPSALEVKVTATLTKDELMSSLHSAVLGDTFDASKWSDLDAEELISAGNKIKSAMEKPRVVKKLARKTAAASKVVVPDVERNFHYD